MRGARGYQTGLRTRLVPRRTLSFLLVGKQVTGVLHRFAASFSFSIKDETRGPGHGPQLRTSGEVGIRTCGRKSVQRVSYFNTRRWPTRRPERARDGV